MRLIVYLDSARRVVAYPEGGFHCEQNVPGIGWCLADNADWPEVRTIPAVFALVFQRFSEGVTL